jgi:ADP-ribose pyrophosphatase YjhB (NUDIX family)
MEKKILMLFTKCNTLKFNEIEKSIGQRSNKVAYHLKNLVKKGILIKDNQTYSLTSASEYLIPYLSEKNPTIPVVLVHVGDNERAFLFRRAKRPYLNKLSLPGGRLVQGESIFDATKRISREKCNITVIPKYVSSIVLEHVKKNKKSIHSFLLILVKAESKEILPLTDIKKSKNKIITSDFKLIVHSGDNKIFIPSVFTKD